MSIYIGHNISIYPYIDISMKMKVNSENSDLKSCSRVFPNSPNTTGNSGILEI